MISYLKGRIIHKSSFLKKDNYLVISTGNIGYKAYVLDRTLNNRGLGEEIELFTYTQVGETVLDLYGFESMEELEFFELLLTLSGIGPRSALDILKKGKIADIKNAVASQNHKILSQVSGIGPKTAEKIVIGLKDKLAGDYKADSGENWSDNFNEALEALIGLGYNANQAKNALSEIKGESTEEKIKQALKYLSGKKN